MINLRILGMGIFLILITFISGRGLAAQAAGEKFQYKIEGASTGKEFWKKQIIHTNLYDVEAEGFIVFYYDGVWSDNKVKELNLKSRKMPNFGSFPIAEGKDSSLKPLIKLRQIKGLCKVSVVEGVKHTYQYKPDSAQLVIVRASPIGGGTGHMSTWVKKVIDSPEPWTEDIVTQKRVDSWPFNHVYVVEVKKGDILEVFSPGWKPGVSAFEAATEKAKDAGTLVTCLHFDEGSGEIAVDSEGNNHGELVGGVEWTKGKFGSGLKFDGKTAYVICSGKDLSVPGRATVSAWFKADDNGAGSLITVGSFRNRIILSTHGKGSIQGTFNVDKTYCEVTRNKQYNSGEWYYVTTTYDGDKTKLYLNGEFVGESKQKRGVLAFSGPVYIGAEGGTHFFFKGIIDELKIYDKVLSAEEIKQEYFSPPPSITLHKHLKAIRLNINKDIAAINQKLETKKVEEFVDLVSEYKKLNSDIEKELAQPDLSASAFSALKDKWGSLKEKEKKIIQSLNEVVLQKRLELQGKIDSTKKEISSLKEKKLAYRPIQADIDKTIIYINLSELKTADSFKRLIYLDKGTECLVGAKENIDKIRKNKIKDEVVGTADKLMLGVTWNPPRQDSLLDTLKALRIKYIGNIGLRYAGLNDTAEDAQFNAHDTIFDTMEKNDLIGMGALYYPLDQFSRLNWFRDKFIDETVPGNTHNMLIPAAPSDIPLKWVTEQENALKRIFERHKKRNCIIHWDIWGEAAPLAPFFISSPLVVSAFQKFLKEKYKNIDALNKTWGANHKTFEELKPNPSGTRWEKTEWQYFSHKLLINYISHLTSIVKKIVPDIPISPVLCMYGMFPRNWALDSYLLAEAGGVYKDAAIDTYPARRDKFPWSHLARSVDTARSITDGGRIWIGEVAYWINAGSAAHSNCVYPRKTREWFYTAFLHGAKFVAFFNWSAADLPDGPLGYGNGMSLLNADYTPIETACKIGELGCETMNYEELWSCKPERRVALYYPRLSTYLGEGSVDGEEMRGLYIIMLDSGFGIDPIDAGILMRRLSNYKILIIPPAPYMDKNVQKEIVKFIKGGGIVITSPPTFSFDELGNQDSVHELAKLMKITAIPENKYSPFIKSINRLGKGALCLVEEEIGRKYRDSWRVQTGITEPQKISYDREENKAVREAVVSFLTNEFSLRPFSVADKEGVETAIISNDKGKYLVIINHRDEPIEANISISVQATGTTESTLYDVFSLKEASFSRKEGGYRLKTALEANEVQVFRWYIKIAL